ncbi:MAG: binding-protein-dependent transport system inner rane component [Thermoleophilia bacterium]|nr:binding-protein-dependent transport system inner rane component [Thermoleophilia bacterium]
MTAAGMSQPNRPNAAALPGASRQGALVRPVAETVTAQSESPSQLAVRRFRENRVAMVALVAFVLICSMSVATPMVEKWAGRTATEQNLDGTIKLDGKQVEVVDLKGMPAVGPGIRSEYAMGADGLGRDVFVRAVAGGSVSLRVGLGATAICILLGTLMGLVGGYFGGRIDKVLTYIVDVMIAFPFMLFAIALSAAIATSGKIGPISASSILVPMCMLGVLSSFGFSRIMRSNAKELGSMEYVEAARALGADDRRIMFVHLLPHLVPTIITYSGILLAGMILGEAGLSFLGVGVTPPTPSWGNLIADGRAFYSTAWWIAGAGGLFVMATVLCANLIGEGLEEAFDQKGGR